MCEIYTTPPPIATYLVTTLSHAQRARIKKILARKLSIVMKSSVELQFRPGARQAPLERAGPHLKMRPTTPGDQDASPESQAPSPSQSRSANVTSVWPAITETYCFPSTS